MLNVVNHIHNRITIGDITNTAKSIDGLGVRNIKDRHYKTVLSI